MNDKRYYMNDISFKELFSLQLFSLQSHFLYRYFLGHSFSLYSYPLRANVFTVIFLYLEFISFVPYWIECVSGDDFALVFGAVYGYADDLHLHQWTTVRNPLTHVLTGNQLKKTYCTLETEKAMQFCTRNQKQNEHRI